MTKQHFSEADLLETYYTQPGEAMPVMMHLARCGECSARYEKLERKLREVASCETTRPETFWTRQRMSITRRVDEHRRNSRSVARTLRLAAAVSLAFFLGGAVVYKSVEPRIETAKTSTVAEQARPAHAPAVQPQKHDELLLSHDAWQSDELKDYHEVVDWEQWVEPKNGDHL
jgi:predicted anti-sigma-YlaC factor YlaD